MPQNKHKSWCGAQHQQQATKDAHGPGERMANDDQEWTYLAPGTKKNFITSFDTHIAGQHTGEDAEATDVEKKKKKKKGRNKISPWEDGPVLAFYHMSNPAFFDELIHSSRARTVIDLCPGSGHPAVRGVGGGFSLPNLT